MQNVTLFCFWASYLVAWILELIRTRREGTYVRMASIGMTIAGLVAHTTYLLVRSGQGDAAPLIGSPHDWLLVLAWIPIVVLLVSTLISKTNLGAYLLPPALIIISAAPFVGDAVSSSSSSSYWLRMIHAGMLAIGAAGILIAAGLSAMYLVQHHRLKNKRIPRGSRPLSLEKVARLNWWAIAISVPMLTTGLALGVVLIVGSWATDNPVPLSDPPFIGVAALWLLGVPLLIGLLRTRDGGGKSLAWRTALASGFLVGSLLLGTILTTDGTMHGTAPAQGTTPANGDSQEVSS